MSSSARLVVADRGDALSAYLTGALRDRYPIVAEIKTDLTQRQRLLVGAATFRLPRRLWVERFYKSGVAVGLRSGNAGRVLAGVSEPFDAIVQTHALFEIRDPRTVMYLDCTHYQSAQQWPDWNPLGPRALRTWYARERRQYQNAAHLFAFSEETAAALRQHYDVPADRVSVVGAGVSFTELPEPVTRPADGAPGAAPTILLIGNDFVRKGGPLLLRAFARIREHHPDARLQIVGTPHPILPQPGVEVLGRVQSREDVATLYREAAVFCLPSVFDPFPGVLLEAMAFGLPCVATATSGVPEMAVDGESALLVPVNDEDALVEALLRVLKDPHLAAALGVAARRRVEEHYLWSQVVDRMSPVLDRMAAPGS